MARATAIFSPEIFRFFRQLGKNNHKPWMDKNRSRYEDYVVAPFHALLDALTPGALKLDPSFDLTGLTGVNFSRINRDIRFRPDTPPYHTHYYLTLVGQGSKGRAGGQLYAGISADTVTAGFRIYGGRKNEGTLATVAAPRAEKHAAWLRRQKERLGRKYESYWYAMEKRDWKQRPGWPSTPEEWKKCGGLVVRRVMKPSAATSPRFPAELLRVFRDLHPLYAFSSQANWKP